MLLGVSKRLEAAIEIYVAMRASGEAPEAVLARHRDLADILEPLVLGVDEEGSVDTASESCRVFGGDFRVERELGRGSSGIVYAATQVSLGRKVAVKVLPQHLSNSPTAIARFRREAASLAALAHPGVVRIERVGFDEGVHWFVMELIEGRSLAILIDEQRRRGLPKRAEIQLLVTRIAKVADALDHVHERGILHRDVKPSNIILRSDGEPVLTDFGIARASFDLPLTMTGGVVGTPYYMAPEQLEAHGSTDVRSDVFSLGATLYEALTNVRPFEAATTVGVQARILGADPRDPRACNPAISVELASVVLAAIEKDPARRYSTAKDFAKDLRAVLTGGTILVRRATITRRVARGLLRSKARLAVIGLGFASLLLLGQVLSRAPLVDAGIERRVEELAEQALHYAFHSDRDADRALAAANEALDLMPDHADALIGKAATLSRWHSNEEAIELLRTKLPRLAASRELQRALAFYLRAAAQVDEAEVIEAALGAPRSAMEHFLLGLVIWSIPGDVLTRAKNALVHHSLASRLSPRPRLSFVLHVAEMAYQAGDERALEEAITTLTTLWPDSSRAWAKVAWVLREREPRRALLACDRALECFPDELGLLSYRRDILERLGDREAALEAAERAVRLYPASEEARSALARLAQTPNGDQALGEAPDKGGSVR